MIEKKSRSAFVPILVLIVVVLGLVLYLVPLVDCDVCWGLGVLNAEEVLRFMNPEITAEELNLRKDLKSPALECLWCGKTGRITLARSWSINPFVGARPESWTGMEMLVDQREKRASAR